jgi:hypothetical protein
MSRRVAGLALIVSMLLPGCGHGPAASFIGPWMDGSGRPLDYHALGVFGGCSGGEAVAILNLSWPVGSPHPERPGGERQFVRDPGAKQIGRGLLESTFDGDATLPADATSTGFHRGDWTLWVTASDQHNVYAAGRDRVERWPRLHQPIGCA